MSAYPWFDLAGKYVGTREVPGKKHNPLIVGWFEKSGHGWIKDDETAWCAAFANAMLEESGIKGTGSVAARSFLNWGVKLATPQVGCIVVLKRGSSAWQGHVGFFVKMAGKRIVLRGGNQGNAVSEASFPMSSVLGYRWPAGMGNSHAVGGITTASLGTGGTMFAEITGQLEPLTHISERVQLVFIAVTLIGLCWAMWAKWDDAGRPLPWKRKTDVPEVKPSA